jgi:WD40 repeat protein/uncharacterized caspase-like protein
MNAVIRPSALALALLGVGLFPSPAFTQIQATFPIEVVPIISHSESIRSVAFSPDGARIVTSGADHTVKLWDVHTGRLIRTWGRQVTGNWPVARISPDGKQVAIGSRDKLVRLWDASSGRLVQSFAGHTDDIVNVVFSPDGTRLASASTDGSIKLWNVATGQLVRTISVRKSPGNWVAPLAFSPDGSRIASAWEQPLTIWDANTGQVLRTVAGARSPSGVAFTPDGNGLLAFGHGQPMKLWDILGGRATRTFGSSAALAIALSRDGTRALTGDDQGLKLWETASGRLLHTFPHPESVEAVAISPDGTQVLSHGGGRTFSSDGTRSLSFNPFTAKLWDAASGQLIRTFGGQSQSVNAIAISGDGTTLASGGDDKAVKLWDAATGRFVRTVGEHPDSIVSMAFSRDGTKIVSSMGRAVTFSFDGTRVASVTDSAVKLWDVTSGRPLHSVTWPSPDKDGRRVNLWDVTSGRLVRTFALPVASWASWVAPTVNSLALSADSGRLLVGSDDSAAKLVDSASGRVLRSFQDSTGVHAAALSPDGTRLASGGFSFVPDKSVKLWDATSGRLLHKLEGHTDGVRSVLFSQDGARVLSGSEDTTIKLWEAATGRLVRTFTGHLSAVKAIAVSFDGTRLISASDDTTIRIWDIASGSLLVSVLGVTTGEWLAITPEGFFAASEKGAELLSVVRGFDVYSIDQFYQSLYRPDLVREKLAGDPRGLVRETALKLDLTKVLASGNAPLVTLVSPRDGARATGEQVNAEVEISEKGGGIGRVEWRINGVTVGIETPPVPPVGQPLRLSRGLVLDDGENEIEVVAYNAANLVASVPARASVTGQAPATAGAPPRMFVLAVGLNEYAEDKFKLAYAVPDAKALAHALTDAGKGVYESVEVTLVQDADVQRGKLDAVFAELASKVRPSDVFVFFLGGHGKTVDGRYYFIPQDFRIEGGVTKAALDAAVVKQGIAQEEWQAWLARVPARKSVLLFDTCESGSLTGEGKETRALERTAANDRLVQATGRTVLTASSDDTDAFEGFRGHGLFTYNVLEALERADSDGNGRIEVAELAAYVYAQVTALSEQVYKQRQVPQVRITGNYSLAKPTQIFPGREPSIVLPAKTTHQVTSAAELLVFPAMGARRVRKLDPKTPVTLVKSDSGWTLIAREGRPLGFVATKDLAPLQ